MRLISCSRAENIGKRHHHTRTEALKIGYMYPCGYFCLSQGARLTRSRLACFKHFVPKQSDRTWLCTSVTLAPKLVESCSNAQNTGHVLYFAMKKNFFVGSVDFL